MRRSNEPIVWSLFGAGGMLLAFLGPAMIVITGFLFPVYWSDAPQGLYQFLSGLLGHWAGKLYLFVFIGLTLFHTAHRLYHGMHDLHLHGPRLVMQVVFYGGASLLTVLAGFLLLQVV